MSAAWFNRPTGRRTLGVILLLMAVVALLGRYTALPVHVLAPLALGAGFLVWSAFARDPALIVPAGVLLGLGGGLILEQVSRMSYQAERGLLFLSVAAGWMLVVLLSRLLFQRHLRWPWIPAFTFAVMGCVYGAGMTAPESGRLAARVWPFAALVVAAWLLIRPGRR